MKAIIKNEFKIKNVLHFTQAENIPSIFEHGLVPISNHFEEDISSKTNDSLRLDYCEGATSISLSHLNYKLFYRFRQEIETDWAVIFLKPKILWKMKCMFCFENAASSNITNLTTEDLTGEDAFRRMFGEIPGKPTREKLKLQNCDPTNPQAEVLVFGTIELDHILGVAFYDSKTKKKYDKLLPEGVETKVIPWVFAPRDDYAHW